MKNKSGWILLVALISIGAPFLPAQQTTEGGVSISAGRIQTGERSGRRYYGYSSVDFNFPHSNGGTLAFTVWNDQHRTRPSTENYAVFIIGDQKFHLHTYSTPLDLKEYYNESRGEWGPAGGSRARIDIPPGTNKVTVSNEGSETGIEISDVQFSDQRLGQPTVYEEAVNTGAECYLAFGRTMHGGESRTNFFGYSGGEIALPNRRGGVLTFRWWNDQHRTRLTTSNVLVAQVGGSHWLFDQHTTPLDLKEFFAENPNEWGPGGGSEVKLRIPAGVSRVILSNPGSETGMEISSVQFASGANLGPQFQCNEAVNWSGQAANDFGRIYTGQSSGRKFYGYSGGAIGLPHRRGGRLRFTIWNDQHRTRPSTRNFIRYSYGAVRQSIALRTSSADLKEFYVESPNEWGPAGGRVVELDIPSGIGRVEIGNEGSETGIEISDIQFLSQPVSTTSWGPCGEGKSL